MYPFSANFSISIFTLVCTFLAMRNPTVLFLGDELLKWLEPFLTRLGHKRRRRMSPLYMAGLIRPGDRKCIGPMAELVAPGDYDQLHHFIADGVWDEAPLERELAIQAHRFYERLFVTCSTEALVDFLI
jgi:hypothetical protein